MPRRTWFAILIGSLVGALLGVAVLALASARVIDAGLDAVGDVPGRVTPVFHVTQSAMYLLVAVAGAVSGSILGLIGYAVGREAAPDEPRFAAAPLALIGAGVGAVVGLAATRAGINAGGDFTGGLVTLSVFRAGVIALIAGTMTGGIVGGTVERISRTEALGVGGEAWPRSPGAFMRDAAAAMGLPALGIALGAAIVFGLSQVFLESETEVALIVFGGVAALILAGAVVIAGNPRRK
ncbi:MAG TPA: hypothetical protein VK960_08650 [Acidimicrobiia bacterium]|nr:hypothetical protein [Acidimicrobiia bacterium]